MAKGTIHVQENEYQEILLQAVAVIEHARTNIARHIANIPSVAAKLSNPRHSLPMLGIIVAMLFRPSEPRWVLVAHFCLVIVGRCSTR